jgi:predicted phage terminase large subunit-like protein
VGRIRLPVPLPHQLEVLRHPARCKLVVCGRRWGKTIAGLLAVIEGHGPREGGFRGALEGATVWWVAPSFPIASLIWRYLKRALIGGWVEKSENERRIVLPGGGSVSVKSADNPDSLRGVGLDGVVLDEAAFMAPEAWQEGLRPALADRQGWAIFLSTPAGRNWLYDLYLAAGTVPGWARWQRPTSDNPRVAATELEAARTEIGSYQFAQEFLAEFVTPGGGLFKEQWFAARYEESSPGVYDLPGGTRVRLAELQRFVTVDLAASLKTTADYTVLGVFGYAPDGRLLVLHIDRARREGPDIVPAITAVHRRFQCASVWVEKVGFQLAIVQEARRAQLPVRELPADRDKVSRALPATAAFEGGRLLLPRAAPWLRDLESELLAFPQGTHDDQVDVVSYAVAVVSSPWNIQPLRFFY